MDHHPRDGGAEAFTLRTHSEFCTVLVASWVPRSAFTKSESGGVQATCPLAAPASSVPATADCTAPTAYTHMNSSARKAASATRTVDAIESPVQSCTGSAPCSVQHHVVGAIEAAAHMCGSNATVVDL